MKIAYLVVVSYLDKLVQASCTIRANQATGYAKGFLSNTWYFDLLMVTVIMQLLLWLINGDVMYS